MLTSETIPRPHPTVADRAALRHRRANLQALAVTQPALPDEFVDAPADLQWLFGRDGSLTAMNPDGQWWAGCSLPLRAGRSTLATLEPHGSVLCFLDPPTAGHVRAAMEHLGTGRALIALVPDARVLHVMLSCDDFSAEIASRRLWFAFGESWVAGLRDIFDDHPGLPTPAQFIRLPGVDAEVLDPLITSSQKVFSKVVSARTRRVQTLRQRPVRETVRARQLCVVAGRQFRLWDDAAGVLVETLANALPSEIRCKTLWADEPASSSPLALAEAASVSDAVIAANFSRADAPDLLRDDIPWITWVTVPARIASFRGSSPRDALLLADPAWRDRALAAGWPSDRVVAAAWPGLRTAPTGVESPDSFTIPTGRFLSIVADTQSIEPPERVENFSSHRLLWETIRHELRDNPFAIGADLERYLTDRLRRFGVSEEGFDRGLFREGLLLPAYVQGLARLLIASDIPLRLFGGGWSSLAEFEKHAGGAIQSRGTLARVCEASMGLVQVSPTADAHPIESAHRPIVRGFNAPSLLRAAKLALAGAGCHDAIEPALSWDIVGRLLPS